MLRNAYDSYDLPLLRCIFLGTYVAWYQLVKDFPFALWRNSRGSWNWMAISFCYKFPFYCKQLCLYCHSTYIICINTKFRVIRSPKCNKIFTVRILYILLKKLSSISLTSRYTFHISGVVFSMSLHNTYNKIKKQRLQCVTGTYYYFLWDVRHLMCF